MMMESTSPPEKNQWSFGNQKKCFNLKKALSYSSRNLCGLLAGLVYWKILFLDDMSHEILDSKVREGIRVYTYKKRQDPRSILNHLLFFLQQQKECLTKKTLSHSIYKQQQQRQHCSFQHPKNPSIFTCVVSAKKSGSSEVHPNLRWKAAFSSISSCLRAGTRPQRKSSQRWVVCLVFLKLKHRFLEGDVCWGVIFEALLLWWFSRWLFGVILTSKNHLTFF